MGKPGCAVYGCVPSKNDSRHSLPNPKKYPELLKKWLSLIGNKLIINLSHDYLYKHYRICTKHFSQEDIGTNNTLKKMVYPKLFLPEVTQSINVVPSRSCSTPVLDFLPPGTQHDDDNDEHVTPDKNHN